MTKKEYNTQCANLIENGQINYDMLIQAYAVLDKQVSKYAYLKKKWANEGISGQGYAEDFTNTIKKRNTIERVLKSEFHISVEDIKSEIKNDNNNVLLTIKNCDNLVELVKSNSFNVVIDI